VPATRKRCTKHAPSPKSECGHLNGGKSKAITYAFPPGYRENAEEEEEVELRKPLTQLGTVDDGGLCVCGMGDGECSAEGFIYVSFNKCLIDSPSIMNRLPNRSTDSEPSGLNYHRN
jgi:hypothetical protein